MVPSERRRCLPFGNCGRLAARAGSLVFVAALIAATSAAARVTPDDEWQSAFASAKAGKRLVFVDYYATWCVPCLEMDRDVFSRQDVKQQLADYVVVRIDVDRSNIGHAHGVHTMPTYVVYDPTERELMRIMGRKPAPAFRDALREINAMKPSFLHAAELTDGGHPIEGGFAMANTYLKLHLLDEARQQLVEVQKLASKEGKTAMAQAADIQNAVTYGLEGNTRKAIKMLQDILRKPASGETEAFGYISLGDVQRLAKDYAAARQSYEHVRAISAPASAVYQQADASLKQLP